jgi:hypothetical protein
MVTTPMTVAKSSSVGNRRSSMEGILRRQSAWPNFSMATWCEASCALQHTRDRAFCPSRQPTTHRIDVAPLDSCLSSPAEPPNAVFRTGQVLNSDQPMHSAAMVWSVVAGREVQPILALDDRAIRHIRSLVTLSIGTIKHEHARSNWMQRKIRHWQRHQKETIIPQV